MIQYFNKIQIVSLELEAEQESENFKWYREERGWFNRITMLEGIFRMHSGRPWRYYGLELPENYIFKNGKDIYRKSFVKISFSNKNSITKYFLTEDEAVEYLTKLRIEIGNILIKNN